MSGPSAVALRAEYRADALGVAVRAPRLSWSIMGSPGPQTAYEVRGTGPEGPPRIARVEASARAMVPWPFPPLASRERVDVAVRARLGTGEWTEWSSELHLEGALFDQRDWTEPWIVPAVVPGTDGARPASLLRAEFSLDEEPVSARLHLTAQGIVEAAVNGAPVSDEVLAPGWTSYDHRLRSRVHDITRLVTAGPNAIGIELADGWFRGRIGFHGGLWDVYGKDVAVRAQVEVVDASGESRVVELGDRWRTASGPVVGAGLYDGEHHDARLERDGWGRAGYDDTDWATPALRRSASDDAAIEPAINAPVREIEVLRPVSVDIRPNGRIRLDFGQNISGVLRLAIDEVAGQTITVRHAEVLEGDSLSTRPLRTAWSVDRYTARGEGRVWWQPRFTIHGFRYAEIEGWSGEFRSDDVEAVVMHTSMERRGWFESSHTLLNQLHANTVWSMRDNFVDLPTDCPQRDERLGWTGDIQVFAPAALYLYDADGVLASWLRDVALEQGDDGWVPNFVPWVPCGFPEPSSAAWGDAAVIVPWVMYEQRGDLGILEAQWPSMQAWVDHHAARVGPAGVVEGSFELGDWLDPAAPPDNPGGGRTDKYLVSSAYLVKSSRLVARTARLLGDLEAERRYGVLSESVSAAMRSVFFGDLATVAGSPTAMALGIEFGIVTDSESRAALGDELARAVREGGYTVQTGFVGTPIICDALASTGHIDDAYRLLLQTDCPSWLYPVTMGATTIWERWDSMLPDGRVNPGEMTSFNHYALGAVVDFLHRVVAGLSPAAPGYREVEIRPQPGGGLTSASARHVSPFGEIAVSWEIRDGWFTLDATLPADVTARIVLPDGTETTASSGRHRFSCPAADRSTAATGVAP